MHADGDPNVVSQSHINLHGKSTLADQVNKNLGSGSNLLTLPNQQSPMKDLNADSNLFILKKSHEEQEWVGDNQSLTSYFKKQSQDMSHTRNAAAGVHKTQQQ